MIMRPRALRLNGPELCFERALSAMVLVPDEEEGDEDEGEDEEEEEEEVDEEE